LESDVFSDTAGQWFHSEGIALKLKCQAAVVLLLINAVDSELAKIKKDLEYRSPIATHLYFAGKQPVSTALRSSHAEPGYILF